MLMTILSSLKYQSLHGLLLRQAGTWDPLLQCCNVCTWTHLPLNNKRQKNNYMELKITACMRSQGKFWTKDTRRPKNPTAASEEPGVKTGCWEQKHGTEHAPCTPHHQRVGKTPKPPLRPDPWTHPYPHPIQGTSLPPQGASKGICCLFSQPPASVGTPIKPCLNFLSGLQSVSIDWGRPRTLVSITFFLFHITTTICFQSSGSFLGSTSKICLEYKPYYFLYCLTLKTLYKQDIPVLPFSIFLTLIRNITM